MANGVAKVARRLQEAKETGKLGNYLRKEIISKLLERTKTKEIRKCPGWQGFSISLLDSFFLFILPYALTDILGRFTESWGPVPDIWPATCSVWYWTQSRMGASTEK